MTLTELKPRWFAERGRRGQGITFLCPHCKTVRLGIFFKNPLDGASPHPTTLADMLRHVHDERKYDVPSKPLWTRTGTTFATLTLTPSIDASASGHWHGFVTNGRITP